MKFFNGSIRKALLSLISLSIAVTPAGAALPSSSYQYASHGQVSSAQTGSAGATDYVYDRQGYLTSERWPGAGPGTASVSYARDFQGQISSVTDPRGLVTRFLRDGAGAPTEINSPDGGRQTSTYDEAGNLTSRTTAAGATIRYSYDARNRLLAVNAGDDTTQYQYDTALNGVGRLATVSNASGWSGWDYDAQGNIASRTQAVAGGAVLGLRYTYSNGRLSSLRYPSGKTVSFGYDAERVTSITVDGVAAITDVKYFTDGVPSSWKMGAGAGTYQRSFDTAGRVVSHTHEQGQRTLTWDDANRLVAAQEPDGTTSSYGYDGVGQMLSATERGASAAFSFDLGGNRSSQSGEVSAAYSQDPASNRITAASGSLAKTYAYDAAGRQVSDGTRTFAWNNQDELTQVTGPAGSASYLYNGLGQRVKKTTPTATRYYIYADDGLSVLGEYWQAGEGTPLGVKNEIVYLEGIPVLVLRATGVYFVQTDHLNTPRTIKDAAGNVVWRWASDPYGRGAAEQNPGGVFYFEFNSRLPGQQFDSETGLHYNNARYYDPETGRYLSSDPAGLAGGLNTYAYAGNGPTYAADPSGNFVWVALQAGFYLWTALEVAQFLDDHVFGPCTQANRGTALADAGLLLVGAVPVGKLSKIAKVEALVAKNVEKYEVSTFASLKARSMAKDGLDIHHVMQKQPAGQVVKAYDPLTAPAIAVPRAEHLRIPNLRGEYEGLARDILARDLRNLRIYTNAPNSSLRELSALNKQMYPSAFIK